jgi:hypothetical protein
METSGQNELNQFEMTQVLKRNLAKIQKKIGLSRDAKN